LLQAADQGDRVFAPCTVAKVKHRSQAVEGC
jgi:hypothetical protein